MLHLSVPCPPPPAGVPLCLHKQEADGLHSGRAHLKGVLQQLVHYQSVLSFVHLQDVHVQCTCTCILYIIIHVYTYNMCMFIITVKFMTHVCIYMYICNLILTPPPPPRATLSSRQSTLLHQAPRHPRAQTAPAAEMTRPPPPPQRLAAAPRLTASPPGSVAPPPSRPSWGSTGCGWRPTAGGGAWPLACWMLSGAPCVHVHAVTSHQAEICIILLLLRCSFRCMTICWGQIKFWPKRMDYR